MKVEQVLLFVYARYFMFIVYNLEEEEEEAYSIKRETQSTSGGIFYFSARALQNYHVLL